MSRGFRTTTFRSSTFRVTALVAAGLILIGGANAVAASHGRIAVPMIGVILLLLVALLLGLWRPRLDVTDLGLRVVNPVRTTFVRWEDMVSVENRFVLVLVTTRGRVPVWAVPRQSVGGNVAEIRRDPYGLPDYDAQMRHTRQDASGSVASAAQRVIEERLRSREE